MKIAVVGSRSIQSHDDAAGIHAILDSMPITTVISGGARGVDTIARRYAGARAGVSYMEFLPDWNRHGRRAGIIRNRDIVNAADVVLAFWDGKSSGTKNSIDRAINMRKDCRVYTRAAGVFVPNNHQLSILKFMR